MIRLNNHISIQDDEVEMHAIRSQGAGGQNVNKVSSAIHLRFDIRASSLPDNCKENLLRLHDHRINRDGVVVIKAQRYRTRENNREDAIKRLRALVRKAMVRRKPRKATRPTKASRERRLDSKTRKGKQKQLRRKPGLD